MAQGNQVTPIHLWQLLLATGFVMMAGIISWRMSLGLGKPLILRTVRTYLQLLALGLVLQWIFRNQTPVMVLILLLLMTFTASRTLLGRIKIRPPGLATTSFISVLVSGLTVTLAVTEIIIRIEPWYEARYMLPIAGMVFGNSMTGISIAFERLFSDLQRRKDEVWLYLSLGATPWEAALSSIRTSMTAGMIPTINSMNAVGIVSIPGMMTGQILAGADPQMAARYQIVVMLMISASTAIGTILAVLLSYRKMFDSEGRYLEP